MKTTKKYPPLKRESNGMWYIYLGYQWIPCGSWDRVLLVLGGHK